MNSHDCPDRNALANYLLGNVTEHEIHAIEEHLTDCAACEETLQSLDGISDSVLAELKQPAVENPYLAEPAYHRALVALQPLWAAAIRTPSEADVASISEPASMGQLGPYKLLAKLGQGAMGTVYRALHTKLDKVVAIKVLPAARMGDERAVTRFQREMKALGRLQHPNLVQAHDAGEAEGTHFLVMDYVDGLNLNELVARVGPLPVSDACEIIRQAAVGLEYAREHGLVHRDIKPANLMLATVESPGSGLEGQLPQNDTPVSTCGGRLATPIVKILDLGLALLETGQPDAEEMTGAGQTMGTADFMAPEQVSDSHRVDIRADIYSLGCTLYKLLTGHAPFTSPKYKSNFEKMVAHVRDSVPPIRLSRSDVPESLVAISDRMLAKNPAARFSTPAAVAAALAPFAAGCDLHRLLNEASGMLGLPAVETPPSASSGKLSSSPHVDTGLPVAPAKRPGFAATGGSGSGRRPRWIALAAAAAAIPLLLVIWIIVRDKSGKEVGRMQVPEGGKATVETGAENANAPSATGKLPPASPPSAAPPPAVAPFDANKAREHQVAWAKHLNQPVEMTNSIGMKFMLIPPGEFDMGSTTEDIAAELEPTKKGAESEDYRRRVATEGPQHRVKISQPFYLAMYPVTQGEYEKVMDANASTVSEKQMQPSTLRPPLSEQEVNAVKAREGDVKKMRDEGVSRHPVQAVSWNDAMEFCRRLSAFPSERDARRVYRLPTEAEWEYACRAGTTTRWYCGDDEGGLADVAWYANNSAGTRHPVGEKLPNAWGLHDMHAHVRQWCADWFFDQYYRESPPTDPICLHASSSRVSRGGFWSDFASHCRSAYRESSSPDNRVHGSGFRVVAGR